MECLEDILLQLQDSSQDINFQFKELKELDVNYHEKRDSLVGIDSILRTHEFEFGSCTSHPEQDSFIDQAQKTYRELSDISLQKINIAVKTRDVIDSILLKIEKELSEKKEIIDDEETLTESTRPNISLQKSESLSGNSMTTGISSNITTTASTIKKKKRTSSILKSLNTIPININQFEEETLYCFCRLGSFGDMVGCDAIDCPIEWFHYSCVGLTEPPKGSWYCHNCAVKLKIPVSR